MMQPTRGARPSLMLAAALASLAGCVSDKPLQLQSQLDGTLTTVLKVEGPMELHLHGPSVTYEGTYVSDELFELIDTDETTEDWLLAVLGEPTAKAPLRDGTQIWRWTYRPKEQSVSMLEIFSGREKEPKLATRAVFVQMKDGRVYKKWKG